MLFKMEAQTRFTSLVNLNPLSISADTGEKSQAKVWNYAGRHWAVLANPAGTFIWRLDGTNWTNVLKLSSQTNTKADSKVVGSLVHILLFQGVTSELVSVQYSAALGTYQLWSQRISTVTINLPLTVEIANIEVDGRGRMWLAYDGFTEIYVTWSDAPYQNWSGPITIATGLSTDDTGGIIALPGKVGVFWSDQKTERFGFKTHLDGADPSDWSNDEVPGSQSALNIGKGMADDHLHMAVSSDGTLYCAVKTSYDTAGYPAIALLIRRPRGGWDNLNEVSRMGTRPIVVLNESINRLSIVYTNKIGDGDIVYKESSVPNISFGNQRILIAGSYNNATSTKANFTSEVVILASNSSQAVGILASDRFLGPSLNAPGNNYTQLPLETTLSWNPDTDVLSYQVQVSKLNDFSSLVFDQSNITSNSALVTELSNNINYHWRVRATTTIGDSEWSTTWNFKTTPASPNATMVGHWKMDEGSGRILKDASEYLNNANITGSPVWENGRDGQALRFNSTPPDAKVVDNASLEITEAITIAAWVRPEKKQTQYLIKKADHNSIDGYELSLSLTGSAFFRLNQESSGDTYRVDSQVNYPTEGSAWMHVAATFDGMFMRIYIDGIESNFLKLSSPVSVGINQLPLSIGSGNDGFRSFEGTMDDVRLFKVALSDSEIFYLANSPLLASPVNEAISIPVDATLRWASLIGAESYEIQVATDMNFVNTIANFIGLSSTWVDVPNLAHNTSYYWRNRGNNINGPGFWSAPRGFTTVVSMAVAPALDSPINGATHISVTPNLSWNASPGADTYQLQVSETSNFATTFFDQSNIIETTADFIGLSKAMVYYWRVFAVNTGGSRESETWSFTTVLPMDGQPVVVLPNESPPKEGNFLAYPNPFTSNISISFAYPMDEDYSISLYDSKGSKIKDIGKGIALSGKWNTIELDGSWVSIGIYLLRLQTANGETKTIRLLRR